MKPKHKRLTYILIAICSAFFGAYILISSFSDNLIFFYSPNDLKQLEQNDNNKFQNVINNHIRIGGLVKEGSYKKDQKGNHEFLVTDNEFDIKIFYQGILPPIFREGQGIVAQGQIDKARESSIDGFYSFQAKQLITKHDENYMPPEIKKSLERYGHPSDAKISKEDSKSLDSYENYEDYESYENYESNEGQRDFQVEEGNEINKSSQ
jgi:cytochrome c-type biogenesis protein CcmE